MCGPRMGWGMIYWRGCFCGLSGIRGGAIFVGEPWRRCLAGFRGCPDWRVLSLIFFAFGVPGRPCFLVFGVASASGACDGFRGLVGGVVLIWVFVLFCRG